MHVTFSWVLVFWIVHCLRWVMEEFAIFGMQNGNSSPIWPQNWWVTTVGKVFILTVFTFLLLLYYSCWLISTGKLPLISKGCLSEICIWYEGEWCAFPDMHTIFLGSIAYWLPKLKMIWYNHPQELGCLLFEPMALGMF